MMIVLSVNSFSSLAIFDGTVTLNAAAPTGEVRCEVRDFRNRPVESYTFDDCVPMKCDESVRFPLRWKNRKNLYELKGKVIRLSFTFHNAHLYALRGDYHIIDAFDRRRIDDGLAIDTTRFGS